MEELWDRITISHEDIRSKTTAISGLFLPFEVRLSDLDYAFFF